MRKIFVTLALLLSASSAACSAPAPPIDVSGLTEASMNFDQEGVRPFLHQLSSSITSNLDAGALATRIDSLPIEQSGNWEFHVDSDGQAQRLVVVSFKEGIDAPDLAFYTSPELAAKTQQQLESFAQAQGW